MTMTPSALPVISELPVPLERDVFLRTLLRELAGTLPSEPAKVEDAVRKHLLRMLEEERAHVGAVEQWAASLGQQAPDPKPFSWRLPAEH